MSEAWRFRPDIEGLRAVAIVGVVLFHAGIGAVPGGFLGVDVFFVLSGFLITGVLVSEVRSTGTISLPAFWARRIRRLLPAATLVSLVTLVLVASLESPFALRAYAKSAIAFATYWSNLLFVRRTADYFDHSVASDPFLHTWSLAIEEQYYLLFAPLCLVLVLAVRHRTRDSFRRGLLIGAGAVSILSFAGSLWLTASHPLLSFYGLPSRAWEFGVGGMLALAPAREPSNPMRYAGAFAGAGLLMIVTAFLVTGVRAPHPGWITLLPVLGTALLIHTGSRGDRHVRRVLEAGTMRWLGRLSYSWYLWHWPVTVYWKEIGGWSGIPLFPGMPLISLALAQLTYLAVEAPARRAPWLQAPRRSLSAALLLAVVTVTAGGAAVRLADRRIADPVFAVVREARDIRRLIRDGCHLNLEETVPRPCAYGDLTAERVLVLFGDSHAAQWLGALEPYAVARGVRILPRTKSNCPSVALTVQLPASGRAYAQCDRWRETVFREIDSLKPFAVVLANYTWHVVRIDSAGDGWSTPPPPPAQWRAGLQGTIARMPEETAILLIEDSPRPGFDVPECLFRSNLRADRCTFAKDSAFAPGVRAIGGELAASDPRVFHLDLADEICPTPVCEVMTNGMVRFADHNHLSVRYVQSLAPVVARSLDRIPTLTGALTGGAEVVRQPRRPSDPGGRRLPATRP